MTRYLVVLRKSIYYEIEVDATTADEAETKALDIYVDGDPNIFYDDEDLEIYDTQTVEYLK